VVAVDCATKAIGIGMPGKMFRSDAGMRGVIPAQRSGVIQPSACACGNSAHLVCDSAVPFAGGDGWRAPPSTICLLLSPYPAPDSRRRPSVNETLVATCQMFLVPVTILFAAVGVANTRFVKFLVCLLGVAVVGLWIYRIWLWTGLSLVDRRTGLGLAGLFGFCWVLTLLHQLKSMFASGYDR
jgi:hypothetical protein